MACANWVMAQEAAVSPPKRSREKNWYLEMRCYRNDTQQGLCSHRWGHAGQNSPQEYGGKTVGSNQFCLFFACVSVVTPQLFAVDQIWTEQPSWIRNLCNHESFSLIILFCSWLSFIVWPAVHPQTHNLYTTKVERIDTSALTWGANHVLSCERVRFGARIRCWYAGFGH